MATPNPRLTATDTLIVERVKDIVRRALGGRRADVYLFGSWAHARHRPTSDIDVAIETAEPLAPGALAALRDALEESTIPYRVDVVDLTEVDPGFRDRVRQEGILWIASSSV
jgi:predicted nucleotidyltransferase